MDRHISAPAFSARTLARWLLVTLVLFATCWLLWQARTTLLPFVLGGILALALSPLVNRLARFLPRWLAILTFYAAGFVLLVLFIDYVAPVIADQIQQAIDSIPSLAQMQAFANRLLLRYQDSVPAAIRQPINAGVRQALETMQSNVTLYIRTAGAWMFAEVIQAAQTLTFLVGFLAVPFWLFYVLNSAHQGRVFVNKLLHPRIRADFWNIWDCMKQVISDYVRGQLILGAAVGAMVGVGMLALRLLGFPIPFILLLALIAGVTELIPYLGPILGALPGILAGLLISPTTALAMLGVYIIVQQTENYLLVPRIIGASIAIHPAILIVILFAAGGVFGLPGIFLAPPLAAIGRDVFVYTYRRLDGLAPADAGRAGEDRQGDEAGESCAKGAIDA
jgi:predicted PurR-regulated permease PerM